MHWLKRAPIKEALLFLYLAIGGGAVLERLGSLGASPSLLVYAGLYAILAGGLWVAASTRAAWLRWPLAVLLFVSAAFLDANERILGTFLSFDTFLNLLGSAGFADDVIDQHGRAILFGTLAALPLLPAIGLAPRAQDWRAPAWLGAGAPLAALLLLTGLLYVRGGDGSRGLPGAYPPLAYLLLAGAEQIGTPHGDRRPVTLVPGTPTATGDVVLLIDESIAAGYLDIAGSDGVASGLLHPPPGVAVHNFGVAASITNCSLGSNITLRHGGTRDGYARLNALGPTIWDYARKAGYRTVYLDAQRTDGGLQNGMDAAELGRIQEFVQFGDTIVRDRDQALADRLAALLGNGRREFILVNKLGAHFPVHDKYPDALARYAPALPRGQFAGISDTGSRAGFDGDAESWRRYRNAYRNTLLWNVEGFFRRLLAGGLHDATIVYTSDHGQELHERGRPGLNTHCGAEPAQEEGAVPLAVLTGAAPGGPDWAAAAARNRNRASHYQLFPTLLGLMGYDPKQVTPEYGVTLTDSLDDELRFNTLFNARFGRKPVWRRIDPATLARPPRADFAGGE